MAPATANSKPTIESKKDVRPITLRSQKKGYSLRLRRGEDVLISGQGEKARYETKAYGKWADFTGGQCILQADKGRPGAPSYLSLWGSREEAVKALKSISGHGVDFIVVPDEPVSAPAPAAT